VEGTAGQTAGRGRATGGPTTVPHPAVDHGHGHDRPAIADHDPAPHAHRWLPSRQSEAGPDRRPRADAIGRDPRRPVRPPIITAQPAETTARPAELPRESMTRSGCASLKR
jgi:hypothetical protein